MGKYIHQTKTDVVVEVVGIVPVAVGAAGEDATVVESPARCMIFGLERLDGIG